MRRVRGGGQKEMEGQLANQIFRHDGDILSRISRLRFFFARAWKIEILEFVQIPHLAEAHPHLPHRCTVAGGALESTFYCYNLHFALILLFAALALPLSLCLSNCN